MKALTIRDTLNKLIAFGPDDGMYDPGVPIGCTKQFEDSYEVVKNEYFTNLPPTKTETQVEKEKLLALLTDPDIMAAVKQASITTK